MEVLRKGESSVLRLRWLRRQKEPYFFYAEFASYLDKNGLSGGSRNPIWSGMNPVESRGQGGGNSNCK